MDFSGQEESIQDIQAFPTKGLGLPWNIEPDEIDLNSSHVLINTLLQYDIRLIRGTYLQWLYEEQRPFPRRQDVDHTAFVTASELEQWRRNWNEMQTEFRIISVSHVWESESHPDPAAYQLEVLARARRWPASRSWYFIDFMSLDQPGTHVLPHIHVLYAHEMTFTYQIPSLTPETKFQEALALEETAVKALKPPKTLLKHLVLNDRPYSQRGWCQAEVQWSLLRSNLLRLVRLGPQTDEVGCSPMAPRYFQALLLKKEMAFTDPRDQDPVVRLQEKTFAIKASKTRHLQLAKLPPGEVSILAEALPLFLCLSRLSLSDSQLSLGPVHALAEGLDAHASLQDLDISYNSMMDSSALGVAEILRRNRSIKRLDMSMNSLSHLGAGAIASGLVDNTSLEELVLQGNEIGCRGARVLAEALRRNQCLQKLNIADNEIEDAGAAAFVVAFPHKSLRILDLSKNLITKDCLSLWKPVLSGPAAALQLRISGNLIDIDPQGELDTWHSARLPPVIGLNEISQMSQGSASGQSHRDTFCRRFTGLSLTPLLPQLCFLSASLSLQQLDATWTIVSTILLTIGLAVLAGASQVLAADPHPLISWPLATAVCCLLATIVNLSLTFPICYTLSEASVCFAFSALGLAFLCMQLVLWAFAAARLL